MELYYKSRHKNERTFISGFKRYDEDFKQFSQVKLEDNTAMTAKQIQELQKRNAQLEEENLILKKASAIFMQNSK